jgi:hypothetical protein
MEMEKGAVIEGNYRYTLTRKWNPDNWDDPYRPHERRVTWIMLNPSTADATTDDATIRKCIGFSKCWGFDALSVLNLFAFRATDWRTLMHVTDPVGPDNDRWVSVILRLNDEPHNRLVIAWGMHGTIRLRHLEMYKLLEPFRHKVWCFGLTSNQQPIHPLMLPYRKSLVEWDSCYNAQKIASAVR